MYLINSTYFVPLQQYSALFQAEFIQILCNACAYCPIYNVIILLVCVCKILEHESHAFPPSINNIRCMGSCSVNLSSVLLQISSDYYVSLE